MNNFEKKLMDDASVTRIALVKLKNAMVACGRYDFASELREKEKELWPETEEYREIKMMVKDLSLAMRMVELNISEETCHLIHSVVNLFDEKKGDFSLEDAAKLMTKQREVFFDEFNR